ncbi:right-handed parallel beta-helix repeat-containing protein [Catellatospora tritici]|uniref:right-handed parallel beta-helix repeat-containing protein n=1 Tax=Catellatospora tritici TaxID=2851566 RepID=UPI001C2D54A3|nr:right-handed parallel beta-helix repeat-containing protein [Catellatospora tritici]MBV1856616.1 right-handed parallel beta-helix repeat-containing protein [Catellatospora tritici]
MESLSRRRALRAGVVTSALIGGVVASSPAEAAAPVSDGWISVTDHGAVGDGVADDTAAIQAAFTAAGASTPNRSIYFPAGRTFKISDQVTVAGLTDFAISGYGATLELAGGAASAMGARAVLLITGCLRFKVLGLAIHDRDRAQQYNGLRISTSSAGVVDGVIVRDVRFNGIVVFDSAPRGSDDIVITNCTTEGTRFGISTNGKDVRIVNNHVAMDWLSTDEADNKGGVWSAPSDYYDGICVWDGADRTIVSGNTITECGQAGVYTQGCTNLVVTGNTVIGCQLRGIEVDGTLGNTMPNNRAIGVTITGNTVTNCVGHINLVGARDVSVVGNRIENPPGTSKPTRDVSGIAVNLRTSEVVVMGNHVRQAHPTFPAIYVEGACTDVTLAWNTVEAAVPYQAPTETVIIHRSGPGQVKTTGKLIAGGGIGVGNSVAATNPGAVVRKIEVFSSTGTSLGWIPVYNSIA